MHGAHLLKGRWYHLQGLRDLLQVVKVERRDLQDVLGIVPKHLLREVLQDLRQILRQHNLLTCEKAPGSSSALPSVRGSSVTHCCRQRTCALCLRRVRALQTTTWKRWRSKGSCARGWMSTMPEGDYNYATSTYYLMNAGKQRLAKEAMKQQVLGSGLRGEADAVDGQVEGSMISGAMGAPAPMGGKEASAGARRASRGSCAGVNTSGGERGGAAGALPAQLPQRGGGVAAVFSDLVCPGSAPPSPSPKWDGRRLERQKDESAEVLLNRLRAHPRRSGATGIENK